MQYFNNFKKIKPFNVLHELSNRVNVLHVLLNRVNKSLEDKVKIKGKVFLALGRFLNPKSNVNIYNTVESEI